MGDLGVALSDARRAAQLLAAAGVDARHDLVLRLAARHLAVLVDLGDCAAADALLADLKLTGDLPDTGIGLLLRFARGRLHVVADRPADALPDLFRCGELAAIRRADHPAVLPWRSETALALWRTGAREAASRLATAEVELARRDGNGTPALGRALRVQGMVLDDPAGIAALAESARVLDGSPRRFELTLTLVEYGTRLNEARRRPPARRVLRTAIELAEQCGSSILTDRARTQYAVAGGRLRPVLPTGASGLTAAERRAANLAAMEMTNRQIAEELFLSVRTVEIHLTNTYRKLGISRRFELAAALAVAPPSQS